MPKIDRFQRSAQGPGVVRQPVADNSGMIAAGQALMRAGTGIAAEIGQEQRRQQEEAKARAEQARRQQENLTLERSLAETEVWADQTFAALSESAEPGGVGFEDAVAKSWQERRQQVLDGAQALSPEARQMLETRLDTWVGLALGAKSTAFASAARVSKAVDDFAAIRDIRANQVMSDPDGHDEQAAQLGEAIMGLGLPAAKTRAIAQDMRATLAKATTRGQIDRNPAKALQWLDGGRFDAALDPDAKAVLRNQADGAVRQRDAQARQEAAINRALFHAELRNTEAALRAGENIDIDPARIRATLGEQEAGPVLEGLQRASRFGADAKALQWASPDEVSRLLTERHPLSGRPVLHNPDGTISTEESITITDERVNGGKPTNIPSIWGGKRPPEGLDDPGKENWAIEQALASGQTFQAFDSIDAAVQVAEERTQMLGDTANGVRGYADRARDHAALVQMVQQRQRALAADPAGYVAQAPAVAALQGEQKARASLAEQARLGVPPALQRVLSKGEASQIVATMQAGGVDAQDVGDQFVALQQQYGDYWGQAFAELSHAGLPAGAFVLGTMDRQEQAAARAAMAEAIRTGHKALRELVDQKELAALPAELQQRMEDFTATMLYSPGGQENAARMTQGVEMLAMHYMAKGDDAGQAAKRAYKDVIGSHYSLTDTFRVPQPYDVDAVEDAANAMQSALTRVDAPPSRYGDTWKNQESNFLRSVKRQGFWVTAGDEKGLFLMDGLGNPVKVDKQPVYLPFDQAVTEP